MDRETKYSAPEGIYRKEIPLPKSALSLRAKMDHILKDPICYSGTTAGLRTLINTVITLGDFIPLAGDAVSWSADALKVVRRVGQRFGIDIKFLDLPPDVGLFPAIGSEAFEVVSFGFFPSHIIETTMQLKHDLPKIKRGVTRAKEIWKGNLG